MDEQQSPPYFNGPIRWAQGVTLLSFLAASVLSLATRSVEPYMLLVPVVCVIWLVGTKFAAPLVPLQQLCLAALAIVILHFGIEHLAHYMDFPAIYRLGELAFPVLCVWGFGARWVKLGYLPAAANRWGR